MSECCKKCEGDFNKVREVFKCKDCNGTFHSHCIGESAKNKIGTRNSVRCESCAAEMSSVGSRSSETGNTREGAILEAISSLRADLTKRADQQLDKLNTVQDTLNAVIEDVRGLKVQYQELKTVSDNTVQDVSKLQRDNSELHSTIRALRSEVSELQQHTRKNNVLVSGIPVTAREDLFYILSTIARCLQLDFHPSQVSAVHRLPPPRDNNRPPSIVVCFVSRAVRTMWVSARRTRRSLEAKEICSTFPGDQVYINEHLTTETREVFNAARKLVKAKMLETVWTSDCRVLAKKSPTGAPFRITSLRQISEIEATARQSVESSQPI